MTAIAPNAANALSLFFPNDQPTPFTFTHFLNLPPLLEPISPALAALHLARIRLVLSIPPGVIDQTAWCPYCGGLRDALPPTSMDSTSRKSTRKTSSTSPSKISKKKKAGNGPGAKRSLVKVKWAKECKRCGMEYKRPKPEPEARAFPSARAVRAVRTKRKAGTGTDETGLQHDQSSNVVMATTQPEPDSSGASSIPATPPSVLDNQEPQAQALPTMTMTMPLPHLNPTDQYPIPSFPPPPLKYVHNHNLIHVHTSSPHPPTYDQPPRVKVSPPPKEMPKEKGKKRKKSGLARLLAENKEREGGGSGTGTGGGWGLD